MRRPTISTGKSQQGVEHVWGLLHDLHATVMDQQVYRCWCEDVLLFGLINGMG